jgi:hypothetical protein
MKRRLHIGWVLFAIVMVWAECMGDVPKLLFPHRTTPIRLFMAITNLIAVIGLAFYAFQIRQTKAFWRLYAPAYAIVIAAQFGLWMPSFVLATIRIMSSNGTNFLTGAGMVAVTLPILAMTTYSIIALFRLGDWIGPTRGPAGMRQPQLNLPF